MRKNGQKCSTNFGFLHKCSIMRILFLFPIHLCLVKLKYNGDHSADYFLINRVISCQPFANQLNVFMNLGMGVS